MAKNGKQKIEAAFPQAAREGRIIYGRKLGECASFKAGGPADVFALPSSKNELRDFLFFFIERLTPVFVLGAGSNVLFGDGGFRGAVVSTELIDAIAFEHESSIKEDEIILKCGAGCPMDKAVDISTNEGFAGLEKFAGLPGTAGGAAFMNARCYGASVSDAFAGAELFRFRLEGGALSVAREQKGVNPLEWGYKKSPFNNEDNNEENRDQRSSGIFGAFSPGQEEFAALAAVSFRLRRGERHALLAEAARCRNDREQKGHFRLPSAGSVFKNSAAFGRPTGAIIDGLGLRGMREGGAMIAPWHGNIVVNCGGATARDIRRLIEKTAAIVFEKTGLALEREVIFAGEFS